MIGALARTHGQPRRTLRRRFDAGGSAGAGQDDSLPLPPPAPPGVIDPGSGDYIPPAALPNGPLAQPPAPQDAGSGMVGPISGSPDPDAGRKLQSIQGGIAALSNRAGAQNAIAVLQAAGMGGGPLSTNLPLLAAAGAMMQPTRTGSIGESLGNAFGQGARVAEEERQRMEQAALRMQQSIWQNDYRQQMADTAKQRANTYSDATAAKIPLMQAQSGMDMARAALLQARAATAGAAHTTEGDVLNEAAHSLVGAVNPDTNQPWTLADAFRHLKGVDVRQQNADTTANKGSWQAGEGLDETGQKVPGSYFFPAGGGDPVFHAGVVQQRTLNTDLRRQALGQINDARDRALVERSTDAQVRAAQQYIHDHTQRDIGGKITAQPSWGGALRSVQNMRDLAEPPAGAPQATPANKPGQGGGQPSPTTIQPGYVDPATGYTFRGGNPRDKNAWAPPSQ